MSQLSMLDASLQPTADLWSRVKADLVGVIKALQLPGMGEVISQYSHEDRSNVSYPCVLCTTAGLDFESKGGDSLMDQYSCPVWILILDNPGTKTHQQESVYMGWIKRIVDAGHQQRLPATRAAGTIARARIDDPRLKQYQGLQAAFLAEFEAWEGRGNP